MAEESLGGDLQKLWYVANSEMAAVSKVYADACKSLQGLIDSTDDDKLGRAFPSWRAYEYELAYALFLTGSSVNATCQALNRAIDQYKFVDGKNGGELTKIGKELDDILNDPNKTDRDSIVSLKDSAKPPTDPKED